METIQLSKKSFWFKYWKFVTNAGLVDDAPKDTCSMKRQLILYTLIALFALPFFVILHLLKKINETWDEILSDKFWIVLITLFQFMISFVSLIAADAYSISLLLGYLVAAGYVFGCLLIGIIVVAILIGSMEKWKEYKMNRPGYDPYKKKRPNLIVVLYRAAKDRLCSKIEFVD